MRQFWQIVSAISPSPAKWIYEQFLVYGHRELIEYSPCIFWKIHFYNLCVTLCEVIAIYLPNRPTPWPGEAGIRLNSTAILSASLIFSIGAHGDRRDGLAEDKLVLVGVRALSVY